MKPTPPGWPRISTALWYDDPLAAIDWLCRAFGFEVQMKVVGDDGQLAHSELVFGGGLVMVGGAGTDDKMPYRRSPSQAGGNTQNLMVYVDDIEAHCVQAREAGAVVVKEPTTTDYGEEYWSDRGYQCRDIGGHYWWFYQRMRTGKV